MRKRTSYSITKATRQEGGLSLLSLTGMGVAILIIAATATSHYRHVLNCDGPQKNAALCAALGGK